MIYYSNYNTDYDELVKEFMADNDIERTNTNYNIAYGEVLEYEWEDFNYIIRQLDKKYDECVMWGCIGSWNGNFKGYKIGSFETLINNLLKDCDFVEIGVDDTDNMYIKCSHHDGTNYMNVRSLTSLGKDLYDEYDYDKPYKELVEELVTNEKCSVPMRYEE